MLSAVEAPRRSRHRLRVVEAMGLLLLARFLIILVPMRYWRSTLGRIGTATIGGGGDACRHVIAAVLSGAQRLPVEMVCLPRAMAVQWMLRRRGVPSALVFGILPQLGSGDIHALHAWVESGGQTVIGDDPTREYRRGLSLVQP